MHVFYEVIHTLHEYGYTIFNKGEYHIARDISLNTYDHLLSLPDLIINYPNLKDEVVISRYLGDVIHHHYKQENILMKVKRSQEIKCRLNTIIKGLNDEQSNLVLTLE